MEKMINNQLSEDNIYELNVLENMEQRISILCEKLRLKSDIHTSWVDLCNILSPSNPMLMFNKIVDHYNSLEIMDNDIYYKILNELENLGKNDIKFWHCDVFWFQSIATIIYKYFRNIWWLVIEYMQEIHNTYHCFDVNDVFVEAVLTLRVKGLVSDELFWSGLDGKKLN